MNFTLTLMQHHLKGFIVLVCFLFLANASSAQQKVFTRTDSLRGTITPERAWWDLTYYHLDMSVNIENKSISGMNSIHYKVLKSNQIMQWKAPIHTPQHQTYCSMAIE